jgi:hypothetical protein
MARNGIRSLTSQREDSQLPFGSTLALRAALRFQVRKHCGDGLSQSSDFLFEFFSVRLDHAVSSLESKLYYRVPGTGFVGLSPAEWLLCQLANRERLLDRCLLFTLKLERDMFPLRPPHHSYVKRGTLDIFLFAHTSILHCRIRAG